MIATRRTALTLMGAFALAACHKGASAPAGGDMTLGPADAKVKVIEYASLSCPHCARFNNDVFPLVKAKYIDTGKVSWTFREFLTPPEEVAAAGALLARCAGKDKFFGVVDAIYRSQEEMNRTGDVRGVLLRVAQSAGMTEKEFDACISDDKAIKALQDRVQGYVDKEKISSTPTFVINGQKLEGEQTIDQLSAVIDPLLK